jgi:hypothetical protein
MTENPKESQPNPPESQGIPATATAVAEPDAEVDAPRQRLLGAPLELADQRQVGLGHVVFIRHPRPRFDPGCSAVRVAIFNEQNG